MTFEKEHNACVRSASDFIDNSYQRNTIEHGVDVISGKLVGGDDTMMPQSYRFDRNVFTFEKAKEWCQMNNIGYQRIEPAYQSYEPMKLETKEVKNVEIFEAGTWKDIKYTENTLDEIITNFKKGVIDPYVKIGHDEEQPLLKEFSLGWVADLRRVGTKLIADFKQVPKTIAELIEAGALKKKSVEIFKTYKDAAGNTWNNVLRAVAIFGANGEPALNTLSDFVSLYQNTSPRDGEIVVLKNTDKENRQMDEITIKKSEYDSLLSFKNEAAKVEPMSAELEKMKADKAESDKKADAATKRAETAEGELAKYKADAEKMKADNLKKEAEAFIDEQVKAFKVLPKYRDMLVADYVVKSQSPDQLALFKDEVTSRARVIPSDTKNGGGSMEPAKDTDELNAQIEAYKNEHHVTWAEAYTKITGEEI